ncbi:Hypothetical protein CINCED_3A022981 [Cinara cedri]|uniref:Uncharacterized protein n=1 Tax=Cinara cedri TaxID=506608 RepID=A0A5E4MFF9_9HEMI|nr:Hypothetical protein CINCED_3A022981 [Cinara cedri]
MEINEKENNVTDEIKNNNNAIFKSRKIEFRKKLSNGDVINRKWISFSVETKLFYCATCMTFSVGSKSKFISGYNALAKSDHSSKCYQCRMVLNRLIDIALFIGKQNIAYRGKHEGAHLLND